MKKILIYGITSTVGGIETYLINILKNIDKSKFQIDLLVKEKIEGQNGDNINGYYNNIYCVPSIKKHPIKAFKYLKTLASKKKYDVFHINICDSLPIVYALPFNFFSKNTKIYVHSHNSSGAHKILQHFFSLIINKISTKSLACSDEAAKWMFGQKKFRDKKYVVLPNLIATEKYLYNQQVRNKIRGNLKVNDKFVIGHVGRFDTQKNHKGLIDIFNDIAKNCNNVVLILLGTGSLEETTKKYVSDLHLSDKVIFLGLKNNVNDYYQAMDLFVLPSLYEGLPIVSIEAQASGLKCLISDNVDKKCNITGNVEFLPISDTNLWRKKIIEIMNQKHTRENMKLKIKQANYDLKSGIKVIENLYLDE